MSRRPLSTSRHVVSPPRPAFARRTSIRISNRFSRTMCRASTIASKGTAVVTHTLTDAEARFRQAHGEIESIVGAGHLVYQRDDLERRSRDIIPKTKEAVAFASPGSVDEVVALVK